jgi:Flp pilus assembly protein TadG
MYPRRSQKTTEKQRNRRGVAAVEFAICVPVLVLLVLGSIEVTNAIFLRQSLHVAAFEAAKELTNNDGTFASATARAQNILDARSIRGAVIRFTPSASSGLVRGATVRVNIQARLSGSSPIRRIIGDRNIVVDVVMNRK